MNDSNLESNDTVTVCVRYNCYKTLEVSDFQLHKLLFEDARTRFHFKWRFSVLNRDPMGRTQRTDPGLPQRAHPGLDPNLQKSDMISTSSMNPSHCNFVDQSHPRFLFACYIRCLWVSVLTPATTRHNGCPGLDLETTPMASPKLNQYSCSSASAAASPKARPIGPKF